MINNNYSQLISQIDTCILENNLDGTYDLSIDSLDEEDKRLLTRLMIECESREVYDCFFDPDKNISDDDITCLLLKLIKDDSRDNKLILSDFILNRTLEKYKPQLQAMIDERCELLCHIYLEDNGHNLVMDDQTGFYDYRRA